VAFVTVARDEEAAAEAAAERIAGLIEASCRSRGRAAVCLTGGGTPERLYQLLADPARPWRGRIDWSGVHLYWGDERHVPPDHPDSNYGMAARALVERVPVPAAHVHRMRGELADAADAAREYERALPDRFDVLLLGLGEDAHVASIFPGSPLLADAERRGVSGQSRERAAAVWAPHLAAWRITLTPAALLAADAIVMLVAGAAKAPAVHAALDLPHDVRRYPAHLLRAADERVEWFIDTSAAAAVRASRPLAAAPRSRVAPPS
jgi:6-phosphogluconolactonase